MKLSGMDACNGGSMNHKFLCIEPGCEGAFLKINEFHFVMPVQGNLPVSGAAPFVQGEREADSAVSGIFL